MMDSCNVIEVAQEFSGMDSNLDWLARSAVSLCIVHNLLLNLLITLLR